MTIRFTSSSSQVDATLRGASVAPGATSAARIAAGNLRVDAATAEVLRAFEAAGVQNLLIKGISVNRWLSSPEEPRTYTDSDLLVRPADMTAAEQALRELGFTPLLDEREMPSWWREHATAWWRTGDGATVDLHRTLAGVDVDPEKLWEILSAHTETLVVADYPAQTLTIPGRAFLVAVHAAQHGAEWDRTRSDVELAVSAADKETWRAAADLATAVGATPAFAAGLRLTLSGEAVAARLGLSRELPPDVAIRAGTAPPVALGLDQLARAESFRSRLTILRYKLVPPPGFMRHWSPLARRGWLGLALAYLWRPIWLLSRLPTGFRVWLRARQARQTDR